MKIIVAGTMDFQPDLLPDLLISAKPYIDAALEEGGCINYNWAIDPITPGRINVFEEWADEASLQNHFESAPYQDMVQHLPMDKVLGFEVNKYRFDAKEPVYNDEGKATAAFQS